MTLATDESANAAHDSGTHVTLLESWNQNERMRHIPPVSYVLEKLDGDVRKRVELIWNAYASLDPSDPHHADFERELRLLVRALDRLADVSKRHRGHHQHPPNDLGQRVQWSLNHALSALGSVDGETFGRRFPFQTFERSFSEPLWAAALSVIDHVRRLIDYARNADRNIDERMYEGLVKLETPLDPRPMA